MQPQRGAGLLTRRAGREPAAGSAAAPPVLRRRGGTVRAARRRAALGLVVAAGVAGCEALPPTGPGELEDLFRLTVTITNVGTGAGAVDVAFSGGTVRNPCPAVLGPGESCAPFVEEPFTVETVSLEASAEPGSAFVEWSGVCAGADSECVITNTAREPDTEYGVDVRFDADPGG